MERERYDGLIRISDAAWPRHAATVRAPLSRAPAVWRVVAAPGALTPSISARWLTRGETDSCCTLRESSRLLTASNCFCERDSVDLSTLSSSLSFKLTNSQSYYYLLLPLYYTPRRRLVDEKFLPSDVTTFVRHYPDAFLLSRELQYFSLYFRMLFFRGCAFTFFPGAN